MNWRNRNVETSSALTGSFVPRALSLRASLAMELKPRPEIWILGRPEKNWGSTYHCDIQHHSHPARKPFASSSCRRRSCPLLSPPLTLGPCAAAPARTRLLCHAPSLPGDHGTVSVGMMTDWSTPKKSTTRAAVSSDMVLWSSMGRDRGLLQLHLIDERDRSRFSEKEEWGVAGELTHHRTEGDILRFLCLVLMISFDLRKWSVLTCAEHSFVICFDLKKILEEETGPKNIQSGATYRFSNETGLENIQSGAVYRIDIQVFFLFLL
jgi:hypothetical protein